MGTRRFGRVDLHSPSFDADYGLYAFAFSLGLLFLRDVVRAKFVC